MYVLKKNAKKSKENKRKRKNRKRFISFEDSLITVMNDNHHDKGKEREKKPSVYHAINGV